MLELANLNVELTHLDGTAASEERACRAALARALHLPPADIASVALVKRSIDARKKRWVHLVVTARFTLVGGANSEAALLRKVERSRAQTAENRPEESGGTHSKSRGRAQGKSKALPAVKLVEPKEPLPIPHVNRLPQRPVVVGAGCAGLFAALALAEAGLEPLLIERGGDAAHRSAAIERFNATGELNPQSNIQFGLGGAGTFSDGKLATGTRSPLHHEILTRFVAAGAPQDILYDAHPHIGSDLLPQVVTALAARIEELGGEVRYNTALLTITTCANTVTGVELEHNGSTEHLATSHVVLATGHSARDVYEHLAASGVALERKTFAMGVRIEHLQRWVDATQYGPSAGHPALGAAPYKVSARTATGRSVFSFCMCPGGYVVAAASEPGGVVTNGMSLRARAGVNANAGLLANVEPGDLPGSDVLAGMHLQRACEEAAFAAGGGAYRAPAQLVRDFLNARPSTGAGAVVPTYPRGVTWGSLEEPLLPGYVLETLRQGLPLLAARASFFAEGDAVLTGVETRSSSPVRVVRGELGESVNTRGLYPVGEGAGYAGGIMSAATDGLKIAHGIIAQLHSS